MIKGKRTSLEKFIEEQIIGPGGCNYRYSSFHPEDEQLEVNYSYGEVLNTTPGSIYSSAILFPKQKKRNRSNFRRDANRQRGIFRRKKIRFI